jgi:rhodanese-related sulfurtransferase
VPDQGPCYRCLFTQIEEGAAANCADVGVLGVLPGVLGTLQATEAIKLVTGIGQPLIGRLLTYDALELRFQELRFARRADCAVCGAQPTIKVPFDLNRVRSIRARDLAQLLATGSSVQVVDVREASEFDAGHIAGSVNEPLSRIEQHGLSCVSDEVVFVCRSGSRSTRAAALSLRAGAAEARQLEGGLLRWQTEIDPSIRLT